MYACEPVVNLSAVSLIAVVRSLNKMLNRWSFQLISMEEVQGFHSKRCRIMFMENRVSTLRIPCEKLTFLLYYMHG